MFVSNLGGTVNAKVSIQLAQQNLVSIIGDAYGLEI